jgi:pyruvate kinase
MRYTKIVATLGPAVAGEAGAGRLMDAGADVFRCNASHGSAEERAAQIAVVRKAAEARGRQTCVLLDLQGPKIRLGRFEGGAARLETGAEFIISTEECLGNAQRASTSYAEFAQDVKTGDRVLLADGTVALRVLSSDGLAARCVVEAGGAVGDRKGINLPGVEVSTPALTRADKENLTLALGTVAGKPAIDMVALSFVRRKDDVLRLRHFLEEKDINLPIVAKIEKPEAWERLDEILDVTDGVMVARGDLGVELALEKVPYVQKSIIQRARERNVFVITATQMLESMIESPVPTRAEVSDVANAIYDGSDAVMLSAETSVGKFPGEAVAQMARIALETEGTMASLPPRPLPGAEALPAAIVARAACEAAATLKASAIVVFTTTGGIARRVSRHRPGVPLYAFTPDEAIARQSQVLFGVESIVAPRAASSDDMMAQMDRALVARRLARPGEMIVFLAGQPIGKPGSTNTMILHKVVG